MSNIPSMPEALALVDSQYPGCSAKKRNELAKDIIYICKNYNETKERALLLYEQFPLPVYYDCDEKI